MTIYLDLKIKDEVADKIISSFESRGVVINLDRSNDKNIFIIYSSKNRDYHLYFTYPTIIKEQAVAKVVFKKDLLNDTEEDVALLIPFSVIKSMDIIDI